MENDFECKLFSELNVDEIVQFNNSNYKFNESSDTLKWRFRIGYDKSIEPVYILINKKIVGQAGLIPNVLVVDENQTSILWFNKFIVSKEVQGKGLGKLLTEEWMKLSDTFITNCNDNSMAVFRKYGWEEEFSTNRFGLPLNIVSLAKIKEWSGIKLLLAKIYNPIYQLNLRVRFLNSFSIEPRSILSIDSLELLSYFKSDKSDFLLKDHDWVKWRFYKGHTANQYFIFIYKSAGLIFRKFKLGSIFRIHIVYQTTYSCKEENEVLLRALIHYSIKNKIDLIWAFTNVPSLSASYKKFLPKKLNTRLAFYSKNKKLMDYLKQGLIPIQAIDSDYDSMYE